MILLTICLLLFACEKSTEPQETITTPFFNPAGGTYFSAQAVEIKCNTSGVSLYYTTDGTEPSDLSTLYNTPLNINAGTTIKAKAYRVKMKPSAIATATYNFNVGTLYFTPLGGTFSTPQTVTIFSVTQSSVVHYTTDGNEPTEASPIYTAPLVIDGNTTLKAKGFMEGWNPSQTISSTYTFNVAQPTLSANSGTFYTPFNLTISTPTQGASIRYTTDGTEPTETSLLYTEYMEIAETTNLKVRAFKTGWNPSATVSANYTFKVAAPTFAPNPGTFFVPQNVAISSTTAGAEIHYTTDGSEPTLDSSTYFSPVLIAGTATLKARAFKDGWNGSNISTGTYTIKVNAPTFNPPQGSYSGPQVVSISSATEDAEIRYTINGSTPGPNSTLYTNPINVVANSVIQAIAYKPGLTPSSITVGNYLITNTVASPVFNPDPSVTYNEPLEVTLSCPTPGATIHYTLDHTDPSVITPMYTIYPIQITQTTEIRAIAYKENMTPSPVVIAFYNVERTVATPTFSPDPSLLYTSPQSVSIECTTTGADIFYTTDGSEPDENSTLYEDPIYLSSSTQVKAKAFRVGWDPSATATAQYQIENSNQIYAWGLNEAGQCNVPIGTGFIQIDSGTAHTVALRSNGSLAAWGDNTLQQCNFPPGNNYVAVSAGGTHSLALKADGTIVAWGSNDQGQCTVPPAVGYTYQGISAGGAFSLALTSNNKIVAWGDNFDGQCNVPPDSNFVLISAGDAFGLALRSTGGVIAWGNNDSGQLNAPSDNVYTDISAGGQHCIAKRSNGTIVAWGSDSQGQATAPAGNDFTTISAGLVHNLALRADGSIVTWGYDHNGLGNVPVGTGFIQVSGGASFSTALKSQTRFKGSNNLRNLKPKFKLR